LTDHDSDVLVTYDPDSSLDEDAIAIGKQITQFWADGQAGLKQHTHVNYAWNKCTDMSRGDCRGFVPPKQNTIRITPSGSITLPSKK
jgi:hypothetical protein